MQQDTQQWNGRFATAIGDPPNPARPKPVAAVVTPPAPAPSGGAAFWLELASIGFLSLAVASVVFLGDGVSASARTLFVWLSVVALLCTGFSMLFAKQLRLLKSPLIVLPIFLGVLGMAQIATLPQEWVRHFQASWMKAESYRSISLYRHGTLQTLIWLAGACVALFVAAHQLRTASRVRCLAMSFSLLLVVTGVWGALSGEGHSTRVLGVLSVENRDLPGFVRDLFSRNTAVGLSGYESWSEWRSHADRPVDRIWYSASGGGRPYFATFLSSTTWTACALIVLPLLLASSVQLASQSFGARAIDWLSQTEGQKALIFVAVSLTLAGLIGWIGEPVVVLAAMSGMFLAGWYWLGPTRDRKRFQIIAAGCVLLALCTGLVRFARNGEIASFVDGWKQNAADDVSILKMLKDHRWLGCGLGSFAEVWPNYRSEPSSTPHRASSLLALAAETGLVGLAVLGGGVIYLLLRQRRVRRKLDPDSAVLSVGAIAGLVCLVAVGLLGPGCETPAVAGLALILVGCAARGLAGGFQAWTGRTV